VWTPIAELFGAIKDEEQGGGTATLEKFPTYLTATWDGRGARSYAMKLLLFQVGNREDPGQYFR